MGVLTGVDRGARRAAQRVRRERVRPLGAAALEPPAGPRHREQVVHAHVVDDQHEHVGRGLPWGRRGRDPRDGSRPQPVVPAGTRVHDRHHRHPLCTASGARATERQLREALARTGHRSPGAATPARAVPVLERRRGPAGVPDRDDVLEAAAYPGVESQHHPAGPPPALVPDPDPDPVPGVVDDDLHDVVRTLRPARMVLEPLRDRPDGCGKSERQGNRQSRAEHAARDGRLLPGHGEHFPLGTSTNWSGSRSHRDGVHPWSPSTHSSRPRRAVVRRRSPTAPPTNWAPVPEFTIVPAHAVERKATRARRATFLPPSDVSG